MAERSKRPLSVETILRRHPPKKEMFRDKDGVVIESRVSRIKGQIIYVVPGSTRHI